MSRELKLGEELSIGDGSFQIIAGPCSVESIEQMLEIGEFLRANNIKFLRAGIFKPRTNPESFQGLGYEGFSILKEIKDKYGFKIVSEVMDPRDIEPMLDYVDIFQVGTRNMYNYSLLKELGRINRPVILKRGLSATIEEWISAAGYIENEGNKNIILCERGIRAFQDYTRNTLDIMSVPIIKEKTDYPILVDPSHATGRRNLVIPASRAIKAIGADGLMVEVHPRPELALSDGEQSLDFKEFEELLQNLNQISEG